MENEYLSKCGDALRLQGGGVKSGWFISYKWINVWLAGKTV